MKPRIIICLLALTFSACATNPVGYLAPSVVPPERWQVDFATERWHFVSNSQNRNSRIIERVPEGQTGENWKEIVTDQFIPGRFPTTSYFIQVDLSDLRRVVDGFQSAVIYDTGAEALYEWWHPDSGKWPAEHQLTLVKYYPTGILTLAYARKGPRMDEATRSKWIERLKNAKLR